MNTPTWIKLHDNVVRHPKIASLSDRAFRYWVNGLCYASEFLTDGFLPRAFQDTVPLNAGRELLASGLWIRNGDGGITIHDYLEHQRSRDQVERERERNRGRRTGGTTRGTPADSTGDGTDDVPRPSVRGTNTNPPKSPLGRGDAVRILREHKHQAVAVLRSRLGYCQHDPKCSNQRKCLDLIALELAEKTRAS